MKKRVLIGLVVTGALALSLLLVTAVGANPTYGLLDSVNIGDPGSEAGHNLTDWTNVWPGCGWCGPDGNMRLIWGDGGETCASANNWASVTLDAGSNWAQTLRLDHLDGAADDGFNIYVNDILVGTYVDQYPANQWVLDDDFDISSGGFSGLLTIKLEATGTAWGGCGTYGQVAFNDIELWGGPIPMEIDIKPGSDPNCINPDGHGVIPVAILTTATFDAATVDPSTVILEGAAVRVKGKSGNAGSLEDVDADGDLDLVVQIVDDSLLAGKSSAILTGETFDGIAIEGSDFICIVPPE